MTTIFIRTFLVYAILIIAMRIMGKRQIGELEISELVTTLMLSEIATMPIENQDIPIFHAVIPIITLLAVEVFSSVILIKVPKLKTIVSARPSILIRNGEIDQRELKNNRISLEELMCELRAGQCTDPTEVSYAILEKNGKLTIIPKSKYSQPTSEQLGINSLDRGIIHLLVIDGNICDNNLKAYGKSKKWLVKELNKLPLKQEQIYMFGIDDSGETLLIRKANT
ncbi:MAG: DUF421 domain-containing protein [Clostridia bacterium]|nr:DUF421 domain-containing protein [Clostridia bacterium]